MNAVYIVGGARTPIGKTGGLLKSFLPEKLAAKVLNEVLNKFSLPPEAVNQVILGNAVGPGGNIARVSLLEAGWPYSIPGITVDFQCGSGLSAVALGAALIQSMQADAVIAGGVESTSMAPRRQFNRRDPRFQGEDTFYDRAPFSTPAIGDPEMGEGAENVAKLMNISREDMDLFALASHNKAYKARNEGLLRDMIVPLSINEKVIDEDESVRANITPRLLSRMPPAFSTDGKITAGNACLTHDGAAAVLLCSSTAVDKYNLKPEAVLLDSCSAGNDPNYFPLGPVYAINKLLDKHNLSVQDINAFEINEAFAVKVLACCSKLGVELDKVNILGGALAYGHPYGASGAIILLHLIAALKRINGDKGIASIGVAGGQGVATLVERCG
ncbi:MAG: thiolase family protein [Clostridia bacterium]|nr:thiolase family protein [Clostridia bacterium]